MKKYSSVYELEKELLEQGYSTECEVDIYDGDDPQEGFLWCEDGFLYSYPRFKYYFIMPPCKK